MKPKKRLRISNTTLPYFAKPKQILTNDKDELKIEPLTFKRHKQGICSRSLNEPRVLRKKRQEVLVIQQVKELANTSAENTQRKRMAENKIPQASVNKRETICGKILKTKVQLKTRLNFGLIECKPPSKLSLITDELFRKKLPLRLQKPFRTIEIGHKSYPVSFLRLLPSIKKAYTESKENKLKEQKLHKCILDFKPQEERIKRFSHENSIQELIRTKLFYKSRMNPFKLSSQFYSNESMDRVRIENNQDLHCKSFMGRTSLSKGAKKRYIRKIIKHILNPDPLPMIRTGKHSEVTFYESDFEDKGMSLLLGKQKNRDGNYRNAKMLQSSTNYSMCL